MKKKTIFITILTILFFTLCGSYAFATTDNARQIGNGIAGTAEDVGDGVRTMGNTVVNGVQNGAGMARNAGNTVVNGVDTAIERTDNGVRTAGEDAKNQTSTMTNNNELANNNDWKSAQFLGISMSVWMWIILIIVIIIIIVLICKYMKEHDDNRNDRDDD